MCIAEIYSKLIQCRKVSSKVVGGQLSANIDKLLYDLKTQGTYKFEKILNSEQGNIVIVEGSDKQIINLCSNNYLGFSNNAKVNEAAINAIKNRGFGLASGRIICGTQDLHKQLEKELAEFHEMDDCLLYSSCFDANAGVFEAILNDTDCIFSDALNHASIIDGIRLSKAKIKEKYEHANIEDLKNKMLKSISNNSYNNRSVNLIVTDGMLVKFWYNMYDVMIIF